MFIDCHCHLDFLEGIDDIIKNCRKKRVKIILSNGVTPESNRKILRLTEKYDEVKAVLGVYPIDALKMSKRDFEKEIDYIKKERKKIFGIGEVGMDFKEDIIQIERQKEIFEKFAKLSIEIGKPIIVHSRKAEKECIDILEKLEAKKVIMHCFSGNMKLVKRIADNGWFFTIPCNVVFSEQFQIIVKIIPIEQILCETDSPYLHPEKKFPNSPENVIESYKKIAEIKGISLKECERKVEENFKRLFH